MGIKLTNNAFGTLAAGINSSATSITLTTGQGARFPTLSAGDYFFATLVDTSNNLEIVKCTARSTDVLTVVRAQESTTARAYSTGDRIEIRITAQTFIDAAGVVDGSVTAIKMGSDAPLGVSDKVNTSTGYFDLPVGTTAQRPGSPATGMVRYNSTTGNPEWYSVPFGSWVNFSDVAGLAVTAYAWGGGGGGGHNGSGTGGGGGAAVGTFTAPGGSAYAVVIGGGGAAQAPNAGPGSTVPGGGGGAGNVGFGGQGGGYTGLFINSSAQANAYLIAGGGGGASYENANGGAGGGANGVAGGNGGQAGGGGGTQTAGGSSVSQTGSALQGGSSGSEGDGGGSGGGGGGYFGGGAGSNTNPGSAGGGGSGYFNPIQVPSATLYAGSGTTPGNSGESLRSGAGQGGAGGNNAGAAGRLVIRYAGTTTRATGGTITNDGTYTYHTFTSAGTFTVTGA
jgi:hypothetical protein